jgi:hypothetical protein
MVGGKIRRQLGVLPEVQHQRRRADDLKMDYIFGIFDVLGFTGFCENCDPQNAEVVLKTMDNFEKEIPNIVVEALDVTGSEAQDKKQKLKERLCWLTFSDTVFVALPYDLSAHPDKLKFELIFFTAVISYINRRMFEIGLPIRGAVHIGDIIISQRCFAGKAIVDAHNFGKKFQAAATFISEQANALIFSAFPEKKGFYSWFSNSIIECEVSTGTKPVSNLLWSSESEKVKTLCWFNLEIGSIKRFGIPTDFNRFIMEKFTAHGKKLAGEKEKMKVVNTEKLFKDWNAVSQPGYHQILFHKRQQSSP